MPKGKPLTIHDIDEVYEALKRTAGNKKEAAALLGIARSALYDRLEAEAETHIKENIKPPPDDEVSPFVIEHEVLQIGMGRSRKCPAEGM
jgi:hypothetical protein